MYIKLSDSTPVLYSVWALKADHPNVSFPDQMTDDVLADWSVYPCVEGPVPPLGECEQAIRTGITLINGVWTQNFSKERWPLDQAQQYIRAKRNGLLSETDWMALSDVIMSAAWVAYRQGLRDVTEQAGFPYEVIWPVKPE